MVLLFYFSQSLFLSVLCRGNLARSFETPPTTTKKSHTRDLSRVPNCEASFVYTQHQVSAQNPLFLVWYFLAFSLPPYFFLFPPQGGMLEGKSRIFFTKKEEKSGFRDPYTTIHTRGAVSPSLQFPDRKSVV